MTTETKTEDTKKFWAKQLDGKQFDYKVYYNEDDAEYENVWIGGNRNFETFNEDLDVDIEKLLDYADPENEADIKDAFVKKDGTDLSGEELEALKKYIEDWPTTVRTKDQYGIVAGVLTILYGKPFEVGILKGNSQSDWLYIIYPSEVGDEHIRYIESVLFATGTEFEVTIDKVSKDEVDETPTTCIYTFEIDNAKIKEDIAEHLGVSASEVGLLLITNTHTVVKHDYEEA